MNPSPKVITGPLQLENKTACDWCFQGFIAYGCYGYTVVIDPQTVQVVQTVGPQAGCVTHVRWSGENYHHAFATGSTYSLHLACADSTGTVVIWDVVTGQIRTELTGSQLLKSVIGLEWYSGHDESHDLLMVLRSTDTLELWDAFSGVRLWKKQFGEVLLSFALDPFDTQRLIILNESPAMMVLTDVGATKEPSDSYRSVHISDPQPTPPVSGSRRRISSSGSDRLLPRSSNSLTKMASIATNILSGPDNSKKRRSTTDGDPDLVTSCKQAVFNPAHKHIVLLVFSSEIHMVDLDVDLTISCIRLNRSSPTFLKVLPCRYADMLICLHENGSASVRVRRQTNNPDKSLGSGTLDMTYDLRCQSGSLRLLRNSKVYMLVHQPVSEKQVALVLSDGRIIIMDILSTEFSKPKEQINVITPRLSIADMINSFTIMPPGGHNKYSKEQITLRMVMSGLVSGVISPVTVVAPIPAVGDGKAVGSVVAIGSGIGTIQLVNTYSGQVENEFKLFMSPVRGLEWINCSSMLVYSYQDPPLYGNRAVKSDIAILNVKSGQVVFMCEGIDKKGPIVIVKISASRRYCVVVYKQGSMELWNLTTKQLVRELVLEELIRPADVVWYPYLSCQVRENTYIDSRGQKKTMEIKVYKEQLFICGHIDGGRPIMRLILENGVLSGSLCFTHDVLFEGQSQKAEVVKLAWKMKFLVLADRGAHLFLSDAGKKGAAKKFSERHDAKVENIRFAPGSQNLRFLVHYSNGVDIWEIVEGKPELLTSGPPLPSSLVDVCWTGPESIVMATEDACLHILTMSRNCPTPPTENDRDDFVHVKDNFMKNKCSPVSRWKLSGIFSVALMEPRLAFLLKYSLQCNIEPMNDTVRQYSNLIDSDTLRYVCDGNTSTVDRCYLVARLFGDEFDMRFWRLVKYATQTGTPDKRKLTDITEPLELSAWFSQLLHPPAKTNDLIDLDLSSDFDTDGLIDLSNDLDMSGMHDNERSTDDLDISWIQKTDRNCGLITSFGELMRDTDYKVYETARLALHNKKRFDYRVKQLCSSRYMMTRRVDMAVQVLMETDTENIEFKSDYLKACLSTYATQHTGTSEHTGTSQHTGTSMSTMKLAATHLIVTGYLSDGVDLLCLIGKHLDACKYLISYGKWQEAIWLAKISAIFWSFALRKASLCKSDCLDIMCKWADHLWNNNQRSKAVLLMISRGQFTTALQMLCDQRQFDTAALFIQACIEQGLLERSEYTDSVFVEFSKRLTVTEYQSALEHYCQLAGEKGQQYLTDLYKT